MDILRSLDPVHLARIRSEQWNYDEAIELLLSTEDTSREILLELTGVLLNDEHLTQARSYIDKLSRAISSDVIDMEFLRLQIDLLMRLGEFGKAQTVLGDAKENRKLEPNHACEVHYLLGNSYMYERNYPSAIDAYNQAQIFALTTISRLLSDKSVDSLDNLDDLYDRSLYGKLRSDVLVILFFLREITYNRSRYRRGTHEALTDLSNARKISDLMKFFEKSDETDLKAATIAKAIAHCHFENDDSPAFEAAIQSALDVYNSSIRQLKQSLLETEDDILMRVNLAWSYFGKASCLIPRLRTSKEDDAAPWIGDATNWVTRIFAELSQQNKITFRTQFQRLRESAQSESNKYQQQLHQLADTFVAALIADIEPDAFGEVNRTLFALELPESREMDTSVESALSTLSLAEERISASGLNSQEIAQLRYSALKLLDALATYSDQHQLEESLDTANFSMQLEECIDQANNLFVALSSSSGKRLKAEGFYGIACLSAIRDEAQSAATDLGKAGASAGERTRAYLNRSLLDQDFDSVRKHPDFERLFSTAPVTPPSPKAFFAVQS